MDLHHKRIVFLVSLNCPYGGNIIPCLLHLARYLSVTYGATIAWVFPRQEKREWLTSVANEFTVHHTSMKRRKLKAEVRRIFKEERPDVAYTHFSLYNLPTVQAIRTLKLHTRTVWHIHSLYSIQTPGEHLSLLTRMRRMASYVLYYRIYGRRVSLIAVSPESAYYATWFKHHWAELPPPMSAQEVAGIHFPECTVLLNGIDTTRLRHATTPTSPQTFTFFSMGGIESIKKTEYIVRAGIQLRQQGVPPFRLLLTEGIGTRNMVERLFGDNVPPWVELTPQTEDVAGLFRRSSCYVSASLRETQSMAVAEATLYGLPVIQSDIPGTFWNAGNPSVLTFKSTDIGDLAEKMKQVLLSAGDKQGWSKRTTQTRVHNMALLSLENWCDSVVRVFQNL